MYCRNCGAEISDQAKFCPRCGAAVKTQTGDAGDGRGANGFSAASGRTNETGNREGSAAQTAGSAGTVPNGGYSVTRQNHRTRNIVIVVLLVIVLLIVVWAGVRSRSSNPVAVDTSNYTVLYDNQFDSNGFDKWWFKEVGTFNKGLLDFSGVTFKITYKEVYTDIDYENETMQAGYVFYVSAYGESGNASADRDDMREFDADNYTEKNGSTRVYTNSSGDKLTLEITSWLFGALTDYDLTLDTHDGYSVYWTCTTG